MSLYFLGRVRGSILLNDARIPILESTIICILSSWELAQQEEFYSYGLSSDVHLSFNCWAGLGMNQEEGETGTKEFDKYHLSSWSSPQWLSASDWTRFHRSRTGCSWRPAIKGACSQFRMEGNGLERKRAGWLDSGKPIANQRLATTILPRHHQINQLETRFPDWCPALSSFQRLD